LQKGLLGSEAPVGSKWREINGFSVACNGSDANLGGRGQRMAPITKFVSVASPPYLSSLKVSSFPCHAITSIPGSATR
jgi:hypothetical protein